ncbi:MAG: aminotransferase class III-fold pyridoxal phosphate-dependent enzyme [Caldilineaceae bacterium]
MLVTTVDTAPAFTPEDAAVLARRLYGIDGRATPLPSERDQNFRLDADGARYVLKIANPAEDEAVLELQNAAMTRLAAQDLHVAPAVVPSQAGRAIEQAEVGGDRYAVRLLTFVPGRPLATVKPQSAGLMRSVGALLGRLDHGLAGWDHPAAHRFFHWDLQHAQQVIEENLDLLPEDQRAVIERYLARYRAHVAPRLGDLRRSIIHSDGNDYNVMADFDGEWRMQATGVIDFGDMVWSHTVNEAAIAVAYAMLGKVEPLAAAADVVAGYHAAHPLTDAELAVLYDLACARLCVSVCMAARQHQAAPENGYLLISQAPIWELFAKLADVNSDLVHYRLRAACGLPAVPQTAPVLAWLAAQRDALAPVLPALPATPLVLDLSVDSEMISAQRLEAGSVGLGAAIAAEMAAADATVALGRYCEARLAYTAPQFAAESAELPERRTVHLGLDLFAAAGTPIHAPLAGEVVSAQVNDAPLDYGPTVILRHVTGDGVPFYTLYGHLSSAAVTALTPGQAVAAGDVIGALGDTRENGGWPPHLHLQLITDLVDDSGNFPGVARPSEWALWSSLCPDPAPLLGLDHVADPFAIRPPDEILAVRRAHLGPNLSISYREPLTIVRGHGRFLYDIHGQAYLDGVNNVCHVGHCHPHVVRAGQRQMAVLNTNTRYLHPHLADYAERLLGYFPAPLEVVFFVCSGSEANELALRLARTYTGQSDFIMLDAAYHGNTQALVDLSPYKHDGPGGKGAPPWAHKALMPDPYRGEHKGYGAEVGAAYAQDIRRIVQEVEGQGRGIAGFIAESLLGCGGQIVLPDGYLAEAYAHVRAGGGVTIADEVQVGFGRVGSHFWGWETQDVVPDIVTMGKPIGNGHPLAAVVTTRAIADAFANGMEYFNTFGGNPVSCAIGLAVLDVIEQEQLQANALRVGNRLMDGLRELMGRHPLIGDVRGLGLYVGAELVLDRTTLEPAPRHAAYIANRMRDHGILISTDGPLHNVLKLKPPIVFTDADADRLVATLDRVLGEDCLQV